MGWMQEIDLNEHDVALPTGDQWVAVPGSPFQVMTKGTDIPPTFYVRFKPGMAEYWSEFMAMMEADHS